MSTPDHTRDVILVIEDDRALREGLATLHDTEEEAVETVS